MNIDLGYGSAVLGSGLPFVFIGGPCVIEGLDHALYHAEQIKQITDRLKIGFIYKSSYDKANRSSVASFRGPGIEEGLKILAKVRADVGVPVLTDIHTADEATLAGSVVDVIQIPAFLCRQTDILIAAGKTGKVVNVKKGQFMAPWDMTNVVEKIRATGNEKVALTERGTSFGYNNLIVDMTSLEEMASSTGAPVVFDAGHCVQQPGGLGDSTGGNRSHIPALSRAAIAVGVSAIFLETHQDPDTAPCDGPNMWPLNDLENLLCRLAEN